MVTKGLNIDRKVKQSFYAQKEWQSIRKQRLMIDGYLCQCPVCKINNYITPANEVHHIVDVDQDWSKRLDIDNLLSYSKNCHSRQTIKKVKELERAKRLANTPESKEQSYLNKLFGLNEKDNI